MEDLNSDVLVWLKHLVLVHSCIFLSVQLFLRYIIFLTYIIGIKRKQDVRCERVDALLSLMVQLQEEV